MTHITHRSYTHDDLARLQASLAGWIAETSYRNYFHTGDLAHHLYNINRGRVNILDHVRIWEKGETVIGFAYALPHSGFIESFASPDFTGTETQQAMFQWAYGVCRAGMDAIGKADKPVVADAQVGEDQRHDLLISLGFVPDDEPWLAMTERDLSEAIDTPTLPDGYQIRGATSADFAQLAQVHSSAFGSNWTPELYRDEVMNRPGYHADYERVVIAPDGTFAAFTVCWLDTINQIGYFEPVGVGEAYQRKGIGRAMMLDSLRWMRDLGMKSAHVGHELDNPASSGLYANLGFRKYALMRSYRKS